jgi:hypothetical protein
MWCKTKQINLLVLDAIYSTKKHFPHQLIPDLLHPLMFMARYFPFFFGKKVSGAKGLFYKDPEEQ